MIHAFAYVDAQATIAAGRLFTIHHDCTINVAPSLSTLFWNIRGVQNETVKYPKSMSLPYVIVAPWDTSARPEDDRLRPLGYPGAELIVMCFSIDKRSTLSALADRWLPEVLFHFETPPPIVIVGCKGDLRHLPPSTDSQTGPPESQKRERQQNDVSIDEAITMARRIGAQGYIECSALTGKGVDETLQTLAFLSLSVEPPTRDKGDDTCIMT